MIRRLALASILAAATTTMMGVAASPASAAGVYVCYSSDHTQIDYPGILGGGHIANAPTPTGVQATPCASGGAGIELP